MLHGHAASGPAGKHTRYFRSPFITGNSMGGSNGSGGVRFFLYNHLVVSLTGDSRKMGDA